MESAPKKMIAKEKTDCRILVIDEDETVTNRIRSLLQNCLKFHYKIFSLHDVSEIKQKIERQTIDLVFFGLKAHDHRNRFIADVLNDRSSLPIILLKERKSSRTPTCIRFQSTLIKKYIDLFSIVDITYRFCDNVDKQGFKPILDELRYVNILHKSPDGIIITNKKKKILFYNPAVVFILFGTHEAPMPSLLPFDNNKQSFQEVRHKGSGRILSIRKSAITWNSGQAFLLTLRDITSGKEAENVLKINEKRYMLAVRGAHVALWDFDLKSGRLEVSEHWKVITGKESSPLIFSTKEWYSSICSKDVRSFKSHLKKHIDGNSDSFDTEFRIGHQNGDWIWIHIRGEASRSRSGKATRITGLISDITGEKKAECQLKKSLDTLKFALASEKILMDELDRKNKELIELSITDGLTGLYNHRFLQERFDFEYKRVKRYGGHLSCMMIDIDHFKSINDTYGHQFGDQVLRQLSELLKKNSREVDICGRYGGEEFMVITNLQAEGTLKFAAKLRSAIEQHEFECGITKVHVTASIGISEYQAEIKSKQQLIECADTALYQAKTDGRNRAHIWKKIENTDDCIDKSSADKIRSKFMDLSNQMRLTYIESTNALIKAVDAKDPFAKEHSRNVSQYSVLIAKKLGLSETDVEVIRYAALLHDIGKISVKDEILTKTTPLSSKELAIVKRHPEVGVNILKDLKFLENEIPIILHHHERFDGRGYPYGLRNNDIPIGARIVCIADAIDAMTSGRTYKKQLSWPVAIKEIERGRGQQFAPDVVDAVVNLFNNKEIG